MRALPLVAMALAALGCEPRRGVPRGLGQYRFGVTTRASLHEGICQPTDLSDGRKATWCFQLTPIKVGKRIAEVDAYFLGLEPPALPADATKEAIAARNTELEKLPLIELQLKVRGCVETETEQWMRERFGPQDAAQSKGNKVVWQNSFLWAIAFLPSEPGRCHIHFLPPSEGAEIERLKQK